MRPIEKIIEAVQEWNTNITVREIIIKTEEQYYEINAVVCIPREIINSVEPELITDCYDYAEKVLEEVWNEKRTPGPIICEKGMGPLEIIIGEETIMTVNLALIPR